MNRERGAQPVLVDERQALSVYFEALLREIPEVVETPAAAPATPPPREVPAAVATVPATSVPAPSTSEPPAWGRRPFQAMLFNVGGLTLAVPLIELAGVQEWTHARITPLPNHVAWFLGLTRYRDRSVPVVDTALLVLPEERRPRLVAAANRCRRIVFIDEGRWGLACDDVAAVINLDPGKVRWRSARTARSWLAGTVIEHMCALLDPTVFAHVLASGFARAGLELPVDEELGDKQ